MPGSYTTSSWHHYCCFSHNHNIPFIPKYWFSFTLKQPQLWEKLETPIQTSQWNFRSMQVLTRRRSAAPPGDSPDMNMVMQHFMRITVMIMLMKHGDAEHSPVVTLRVVLLNWTTHCKVEIVEEDTTDGRMSWKHWLEYPMMHFNNHQASGRTCFGKIKQRWSNITSLFRHKYQEKKTVPFVKHGGGFVMVWAALLFQSVWKCRFNEIWRPSFFWS